MARQARNYLAGAVSGTALIGFAVVAFVMLVSLQTLRNWPLAALGIGGDGDPSNGAAIAPGSPTTVAGAEAVTPAAAGGAPAAHGRSGSRVGSGQSGVGDGSASPDSSAPVVRAGSDATAPESTSPGSAGGGGSSPSSPASGAASSGSSSGGGSGRSGGGGLLNPPGTGGPGGGGGPSPSETVTGTVNNTVSGVDEATGGTLSGTGVAKAGEEVVDGVAGPESTVGETVDKTVEKVKETVGGLLGR